MARPRLLLSLILLATAALYLPNLGHPFQFDDQLKIVQNLNIADPLLYFKVFGYPGYSEWTTRLTANLSISLNFFLFGYNPVGYHFTNPMVRAFHLV